MDLFRASSCSDCRLAPSQTPCRSCPAQAFSMITPAQLMPTVDRIPIWPSTAASPIIQSTQPCSGFSEGSLPYPLDSSPKFQQSLRAFFGISLSSLQVDTPIYSSPFSPPHDRQQRRYFPVSALPPTVEEEAGKRAGDGSETEERPVRRRRMG